MAEKHEKHVLSSIASAVSLAICIACSISWAWVVTACSRYLTKQSDEATVLPLSDRLSTFSVSSTHLSRSALSSASNRAIVAA